MKRITLLSILAGIVFASPLFGTTALIPPISDKTILGVWEAFHEGDVSVWRLDIHPAKPSLLACTTSYGRNWLFALDHITIIRGVVTMQFKEVRGDAVIKLSGQGRASENGTRGYFNVELARTEDPRNVWRLTFTKSPPHAETFIASLSRLSRSAAKAIENGRNTSRSK